MDLLSDLNPAVRRSLFEGPLSPYVELYAEYLARARYAAYTTRRHLAAVAHFARWMGQIGLSPGGLEDRHIAEFLCVHLPQCECPRALGRTLLDLRPGIRHLLVVLREQGIIQVVGSPTGPIAEELSAYDIYMRDARSLAPGTRRDHLRIIGRLLRFKFAGKAVAIHRLGLDDVRRFVADQLTDRKGTSTALLVAAALRQYFRYRMTQGDVVDRLMAAVPSPAQWSLARLPCALSADETDRLLTAFPCSSLRAPRRAYAIVRMALDLGLRASEIMRLELDDIDWREGTLTLRQGKACRVDVLPLPEMTGRAVVDYLRHERPQTSNRAVFVRCVAPFDKPVGACVVRSTVANAAKRAGLGHRRAHALRHTLACRLIAQGSSLKEVADVLRHRSLNTTLIYAKLDHPRLTEVALPWPGTRS